MEKPSFDQKVFSRGFILSQRSHASINQMLKPHSIAANLDHWVSTFFGPCTLLIDPLLNYGTTRDDQYGVGVLGLCINPFDGSKDNKSISKQLYKALKKGRDSFYHYIDQLSGSFVVIFRENAKVYLLQDAAATRPVYFYRDVDGSLTATSHSALLALMYGLQRDVRVQQVYENDLYRQDPSRYLPGMITPYEKVSPLTANHQLEIASGTSQRFFPREDLQPRSFDDQIVGEIAEIMLQQARIIGSMGHPLVLAATGGRDSRVSAATFSGQPNLSYFSFHMPSINHLSDDVDIARDLATIENVPLLVFELEKYSDANFDRAIRIHSPQPIWPAAALCYIKEFSPNSIHIRSTVSEIGRLFYTNRSSLNFTKKVLAQTYTRTKFSNDPLVVSAMEEFMECTNFHRDKFYNYHWADLFYWEHRNSKWQNVLCQEAEMATDVFIPFNNRSLLKLFMSVPYQCRERADIHFALWKRIRPEFDDVRIS